MGNTIIITDSNCDLPEEYLTLSNIPVIPFHFILNGLDYEDNFGKSLNYKDFYNLIRAGATPTTAQITPFTFEKSFEKYAELGFSIIYIGFSSALSESFSHAKLAQTRIQERFPSVEIYVIDSLSASLGEGLLVREASELLKSGLTSKQVVAWIEENKRKINHWFTVDSLEYLRRGGRLSATSATVGTALNIKPILRVDSSGHLIPAKQVIGRKKAMRTLIEEFEKNHSPEVSSTLFICHGDCLEDAAYLKKTIMARFPKIQAQIEYLGPIIGAHTGPGMLGIVFWGKDR